MLSRIACYLLVAVVIATTAPFLAHAGKRIVVFDFSGKGSAKANAAVKRHLKSKYSVVSAARYRSAAKQLGAQKMSVRNYARVSARLKAHGLVQGVTKRKAGQTTLTLIVRSGPTGKSVASFSVKYRRKLSGKTYRTMQKKLDKAIRKLKRAARPKPKRRPRDSWDDDDDDDLDGDLDESDDFDDDDDDFEFDDMTDNRDRIFDMTLGFGAASRSLNYSVSSGLGADQQPDDYAGGIQPSIVANLELYPWRARKTGFEKRLGFGLEVDYAFGVKSRLNFTDGGAAQQADLPTAKHRFGGRLLYRFNFGSKRKYPSLKVGLGLQRAAFTIDKDAAPAAGQPVDIPNITYLYLEPALALRWPVARKVTATLDLRYVWAISLGEIEDADQYGKSSAQGYNIIIGGEYEVHPRFAIHGGFYLQRFAIDLGLGDLAVNRDGNSGTIDVGGASDRYLGLVVGGMLRL